VVYLKGYDKSILDIEIDSAAEQYELRTLLPFFETLNEYVALKNQPFNCPGHQGGRYFIKHPAGRYMFDFYGENIFNSDLCNADVELGDLLILYHRPLGGLIPKVIIIHRIALNYSIAG